MDMIFEERRNLTKSQIMELIKFVWGDIVGQLADEEEEAAHHVQVDQNQDKVVDATGICFWVLVQARLNDEVLGAEVPR